MISKTKTSLFAAAALAASGSVCADLHVESIVDQELDSQLVLKAFVVNDTPSAQSGLVVNYYVEDANQPNLSAVVDWAGLSGSGASIPVTANLVGLGDGVTAVRLPIPATLAPGQEAQIHLRLHSSDWSFMDFQDDHSHMKPGSRADNPDMGLYQNGLLVYGTAEGNVPPGPRLPLDIEVHTQALQELPNSLALKVVVRNTGKQQAENVQVRYLLDNSDHGAATQATIDWSESADASVSFRTEDVRIDGTIEGNQEVVIDLGSAIIYPDHDLETHLRINVADWTNMDHGNDYSHAELSSHLIANRNVAGYVGTSHQWGYYEEDCMSSINIGDTIRGGYEATLDRSTGCLSVHRENWWGVTHPARYFVFEVENTRNVTISMRGDYFGTHGCNGGTLDDPYLILLSGGDMTSPEITRNDDTWEYPCRYDSRIRTTLSPGTYTIEATSYYYGQQGTFTLSLQ